MKKPLAGLMILFFPIVSVFAQKHIPQDGLQIGDSVPNVVIENINNYPTSTETTSAFRGKLLIIAFWATSCGPCIQHLPKLNALKKKYKNELEILLVSSSSSDDPERLKAFFKRREERGYYNMLPYIPGDLSHDSPVLKELFPHEILSHYAWIGPDGVVKAITSAEHVTDPNIRSILAGNDLDLPERTFIEPERPLFTVEALPEEQLEHFSILIKGYYDGLPSGNHYRRKKGVLYGRSLSNTPLLELYITAVRGIYPDFSKNNVVFRMEETSELVFDSTKYSTKAGWFRKNCYTYELSVPLKRADSLYYYMLNDLNRYTEYTALIRQLPASVYLLKREEDTTAPKKDNDNNPREYTSFLRRIEGVLSMPAFERWPLVDEVSHPNDLPRELLTRDFTSLNDMKSCLRKYGLQVIRARRLRPTLVVSRDE